MLSQFLYQFHLGAFICLFGVCVPYLSQCVMVTALCTFYLYIQFNNCLNIKNYYKTSTALCSKLKVANSFLLLLLSLLMEL